MSFAVFIPLFTPLITVGVTLLGGLLVTNRVTDRWERIRKRREVDLAAAAEFQRLYGEFFTIWKIWNSVVKERADERVWGCLRRSAAVEGGVEALWAKISAEYRLSDDDVDAFGALRQAFQSLRDVIRAGEPLGWRSSGHRSYVAFKGLSAYASRFLGSSSGSRKLPDTITAANSFRRITDNVNEKSGWRRLVDSGSPRRTQTDLIAAS